MIMFLIVVYAGPFLMWKFLNSLRKKGNLTDSWTRDNGDYYYAIAKYDYKVEHLFLTYGTGQKFGTPAGFSL